MTLIWAVTGWGQCPTGSILEASGAPASHESSPKHGLISKPEFYGFRVLGLGGAKGLGA